MIDRNGTKIFKGDVVHLIGGEFYQGYHEIDENIVVKDITDCVYFGEVELLEVIGNIHDNPELMEELVKKETEKAINYWNEKRGNNEID
ncbi:MAG: YopX family protein [Ruminococcus sp.]|nr:YopX family protein [Ruminococcus sp.]